MLIDSAVLLATQNRENGMFQEYVLATIFESLNCIFLLFAYIIVRLVYNL